VVASHGLAAAIAGSPDPARALGKQVRVENRDWTIVGVMVEERDEVAFMAILPASAAAQAMAPALSPRSPTLVLTVGRVEEVEAAKAKIEQWLAARDAGWKERVAVATQLARAKQARQGMLVFKLLMGAITGISLLVGGIGIMNVLLASVAERTREIGIRKAAGARRRDILLQFLAESVAITGLGSVIGVLLGLGGAFGVTAIMRAQTEARIYAGFTWGTVAVGVAAAVTVGIAFGIYPALRAARLSPIDAIRHE
jgi:putative ABC transport system permease protein